MSNVPRKKKKKIPKGTHYCYTPLSGMIYPKEGLSYYRIKTCPFYRHVDSLFGHCSLYNCEVIDQVKECGERY